MQPLTCVPEADETKTMTVAWPHTTRACHYQSSGSTVQRARPARCGCIGCALLAPLGANMVFKSRSSFSDVLFTTSADSLAAADHLMREGAVCTRLCTRYLRSCHAAPV